MIGLTIRMALYFAGAWVASLGFGSFDAEAGTLTLQLEPLAEFLGGVAVFVGTFVSSRFARVR